MKTITNCLLVAQFSIACKLDDRTSDLLVAKLSELLNNGSDLPPYEALKEIDLLAHTHGVEAIEDENIADAIYHPVERLMHRASVGYFLNVGDTYATTVVYSCITQEYAITTLGDVVEYFDDIKALAKQLEAFAPHIEWSEWSEEQDEEACFPIRLQFYGGLYTLWFGDPSWDTDHRGIFAAAELVRDMRESDYLETIISMMRDICSQ